MAISSETCLFTIIIPTFNSAATIDACVQSVLLQSVSDYEVLVLDNLSSDDTVQLVSSYAGDSRISIVSEKDAGLYDAMNKGINLAGGRWLLFLGSDDQLASPDVFSRLQQEMLSHPGSRFIYGDVITSAGVVERYANYSYDQLLDRCICQQSIFYHRSLFADGLRFDLNFKVCADWDLNLKIFSDINKPVYIDLIVARFNLGGISSRWWEHPEFLEHFANKYNLVRRYRGKLFAAGYAFRKAGRIARYRLRSGC